MIKIDEMEKNKAALVKACLCPSCPSWVQCGEAGGFCIPSIGKSKCIKEENGCLCPGCPVAQKFDLGSVFYCIKGSAKERG